MSAGWKSGVSRPKVNSCREELGGGAGLDREDGSERVVG